MGGAGAAFDAYVVAAYSVKCGGAAADQYGGLLFKG